ncbi:MAG: hypothetical protein ACJ763_04205 [Bdellovibrionia bacterium]
MRNIVGLVVVGLLTSVSFASAATQTGPAAAPTLTPVPYGIRYFCEFEGRGLSEHGHQDRDVRCKVEGILSGITVSAESVATPVIPGGPIEIKCSNGYKLESEYTAIAAQGGNLWINAERHDRLATIRVEDFYGPAAQNEGKRFKADLLAANSAVIHGEGKCRFEYPSAPVAPPAPSFAQ